MKNRSAIAALFLIAAAYDGILGLAFLVAHDALFQWFNVTPPNHPAYVEFPAALLIIFALMFAAVARDPKANANLIPYGMLLKLSYCTTAFWYWFRTGIPNMWKPWAFLDLVFLVLFYAAYRQLGKAVPQTQDA
jgi:ammonia channel protein AmtB